jgi:hypothetical protein
MPSTTTFEPISSSAFAPPRAPSLAKGQTSRMTSTTSIRPNQMSNDGISVLKRLLSLNLTSSTSFSIIPINMNHLWFLFFQWFTEKRKEEFQTILQRSRLGLMCDESTYLCTYRMVPTRSVSKFSSRNAVLINLS